VLRGLDLELAPGRPVALTGPSGSGKTSVVLALLRFIDLSAGRLTVDGADARMLPPEQVRALIAWSPEQPALFPAPLRANLRVGAPHATDRQITELLGQLGLGPWLDQLESGLDTVVAPWGHPVSGGELQRLSLARALLANRPVLLLDEPTGHLDPDTAATVLNAVLELAADRSLLWNTHRPQELRQFPEVRRLNPLDLGDAAHPAVPGQGGNEAEPQTSHPSAASDRIPRPGRSSAGAYPAGQATGRTGMSLTDRSVRGSTCRPF
jgi:ABC-type transport system involved in cytochrome bd biosynthesis fused ATPase/permease subunit